MKQHNTTYWLNELNEYFDECPDHDGEHFAWLEGWIIGLFTAQAINDATHDKLFNRIAELKELK